MKYSINEQGVAGSWPEPKPTCSNTITRAEIEAAGGLDHTNATCFNLCFEKPSDAPGIWYSNIGPTDKIHYKGSNINGHHGTARVRNQVLIQLLFAKLAGRPHTESIMIIV